MEKNTKQAFKRKILHGEISRELYVSIVESIRELGFPYKYDKPADDNLLVPFLADSTNKALKSMVQEQRKNGSIDKERLGSRSLEKARVGYDEKRR